MCAFRAHLICLNIRFAGFVLCKIHFFRHLFNIDEKQPLLCSPAVFFNQYFVILKFCVAIGASFIVPMYGRAAVGAAQLSFLFRLGRPGLCGSGAPGRPALEMPDSPEGSYGNGHRNYYENRKEKYKNNIEHEVKH